MSACFLFLWLAEHLLSHVQITVLQRPQDSKTVFAPLPSLCQQNELSSYHAVFKHLLTKNINASSVGFILKLPFLVFFLLFFFFWYVHVCSLLMSIDA